MATKCHQTGNTNMAKIAQKNKYGRCQFLAKIIKADKQKWLLANYFKNLETIHIIIVNLINT